MICLVKRTFDLVFSIAGLIIFSPLMLVTALIVIAALGRPALYSPQRTGKSGKPFTMRKFRSMLKVDGPISHHSGDDDPRLTTVGRWLRKFKLDELPQLWNVAKGEMSIVGPRPESTDYTKFYTDEQKVIFDVRPGITDFASLEFVNLASLLMGDDPDKLYFEKVWDRKMELRIKYVQEQSFWVDLKLIFRTFAAIFVRKN